MNGLLISATSGYYLVYLYSTDLKRLVLCFGLGATQFNTAFPKKSEAYAAMEAAKSRLTELVDRHLPVELRDRVKTGLLDLSAENSQKLHRDYEHASIYHVAYELADLPTDNAMESDYRSFADFMRVVVSDPLTPDSLALLQATTDVVTRASEATASEFAPRKARTKSSGSSISGYGYSRQAKVTGDKGELVVLEYERRKLIEAGRSDLADQIVHEEAEGNRPGWDISSFEVNGDTIYIEVKAVSGGSVTAIELTQNEWKAAKKPENSDKYRIYIVTKAFSPKPKIEILADPASFVEKGKLELRPIRFVLDLRQIS